MDYHLAYSEENDLAGICGSINEEYLYLDNNGTSLLSN